MDNASLAVIHRQSYKNRTLLLKANRCGCFYCLSILNPAEITEFWDEDQTAVCPRCGIDSIIAENRSLILTTSLLNALRTYAWDVPLLSQGNLNINYHCIEVD